MEFLLSRMDHVDLNIAVFTNLATDAAEEGDYEEILEAQGAIFRRLTDPTRQRAIINLDGMLPGWRMSFLHRHLHPVPSMDSLLTTLSLCMCPFYEYV